MEPPIYIVSELRDGTPVDSRKGIGYAVSENAARKEIERRTAAMVKDLNNEKCNVYTSRKGSSVRVLIQSTGLWDGGLEEHCVLSYYPVPHIGKHIPEEPVVVDAEPVQKTVEGESE